MTNGKIHFLPGWRGRSATDRCLLAHELTHWLQIVNGVVDNSCRAANELLAYRVQAACLRRLGKPRAAAAVLEEGRHFGCH